MEAENREGREKEYGKGELGGEEGAEVRRGYYVTTPKGSLKTARWSTLKMVIEGCQRRLLSAYCLHAPVPVTYHVI